MAESILKELAAQVSSPWDWLAMGGGAAAGAAVTVVMHGADLGASIATGATAGITARKALVGSLQRRHLAKRALNLRRRIEMVVDPARGQLLGRLDAEHDLWERRIISGAEFEKQLGNIIDTYRRTQYRA